MRGIARKRTPWILAVVIAALAATGTVLAFWTSSPQAGGGAASVADPQALTFGAGSPSAQLHPRAEASVAVVVSNPNAFAVRIGSLALDADEGSGGFSVDGGHAGCDLSALSFTPQTNGGSGWSVPARVGSTDGSLSLELLGALSMSAGAASACQGAAFTVHLTAVSP